MAQQQVNQVFSINCQQVEYPSNFLSIKIDLQLAISTQFKNTYNYQVVSIKNGTVSPELSMSAIGVTIARNGDQVTFLKPDRSVRIVLEKPVSGANWTMGFMSEKLKDTNLKCTGSMDFLRNLK
jgi:hypothetical protein